MDSKKIAALTPSDLGPAFARLGAGAPAGSRIDWRVTQIMHAFGDSDRLRRDLRRMGQDTVVDGEISEIVAGNFRCGGLSERDRISRRIGKIEAAIALALDSGDFSLMDNLGGSELTGNHPAERNAVESCE